jgi:hypothetical protein
MATANVPKEISVDADAVRAAWLKRLGDLIDQIEGWARELDWSTRRIEKKMEDSQIGKYRAPALLLQRDTSRILAEPIGRSAPGTEGVVDLYLMPAYDDIASLLFYNGTWNLHYMFPGDPTAATIDETKPQSLSKEAFQEVLEAKHPPELGIY